MVQLHNVADAAIWLAYVTIPIVLIWMIRRRRDIPFHWMFWMFGAFILCCGFSHLMDVITSYNPAYRAFAVVKVITAVVSWATVIGLVPLIPKIMSLKTPGQSEALVAERTVELECANEALMQEISIRQQVEENLRDAREELADLYENAPDMMCSVDADTGQIVQCNETLATALGYSKNELIGNSVFYVYHPDSMHAAGEAFDKFKKTGQVRHADMQLRRKNGSVVDVSLNVTAVRDSSGRIVRSRSTWRDVSERLRAERRFRLLLESTAEGIYGIDLDGNCIFANPACADLLGYESADDLLGRNMHAVMHHTRSDGSPYPVEECRIYQAFHAKQGVHVDDEVFWRRDGSSFPAEYWSYPRREYGRVTGSVVTFLDVTERKIAEEKLQRAHDELEVAVKERTKELEQTVEEKVVLLREIHHRVKNNLQVISSLLDLQSEQVKDPVALELFHESRNRVRSMATIHERLYRSMDVARVEFGDYIKSLTNHLFRSYRIDTSRVQLRTEVVETYLPIDCAVPCGLLVNELVSNCLKHAFPGQKKGTIVVELSENKDEHIVVLRVNDDGVGLPPNFDADAGGSFGVQLITALTDQLHGTVAFQTGSGAVITVEFPLSD